MASHHHTRLAKTGILLAAFAIEGKVTWSNFEKLGQLAPSLVAHIANSLPETNDQSQGQWGAKLGTRIQNLEKLVINGELTVRRLFEGINSL